MVWPRGTRRHSTDAARFALAIVSEFGAREIGRRCGVSDRTVRRWASGEDWPDQAALLRLVESLYPQSVGSLPIYSADMAIDGNTRTGGVGEFSTRAARGDQSYLEEVYRVDT